MNIEKRNIMLTIDLGASKIAAGLVDKDMYLRETYIERTDVRGGEFVIDQIRGIIRVLRERLREDPLGVGITVPGIVDYNRNIVLHVPNIPKWYMLDIATEISEWYKRLWGKEITVVLLDDRVAAVLGEAVAGVARGFRNIVSLIIGSGVGLGMIFDNKPYTGSFNVSGAIGWWLLNKEVVGETKKGFLEEELAGPYIEVEMKNLCRSYPEKCRYILYLSKGSIENITSEIIFRAYDEGDILTKTILTRKATILAITIANIISLLAPDIVVLNGTIGVELGKRFSGLLKSVVSEIINPYMRQYINITISELGFKANLIGAASYLIRKTQIL